MKRRSVHLRDGQAQALSELMRGARESERFPEFESEAAVFRRLFDHSLRNADLSDLLSEDTRVLVERERFVENEAKVRNLRTGFETRVKREFKKRWENGYDRDQLNEFAENMVREAHILWPEWSEGDHAERRTEAVEYVEAVRREAIEARETSTFDPLEPSQIFDTYEGVESGRIRDSRDSERFETLVRDAQDRMSPESDSTAPNYRPGASDPEALADSLSSEYEAGRDLALEAVREARERLPESVLDTSEVSADD